jgi:hypothetical protein
MVAPLATSDPFAKPAPDAAPAQHANPAIPQDFGNQPTMPEAATSSSSHRRDISSGPDRSLGATARLELRYRATRAFNTVRSQFRSGDKSTNKLRLPRDAYDLRGLFDVLRCYRANHSLNGLRLGHASLADRWEAKVGNCTEMARMAVDEARKLGLRANTWGFEHEDGSIPHEFAVVELRGATLSSAYAQGGRCRNFEGCDDFWIVDPWAGICCEGSRYDAAFAAKMNKWAAQNKHVFYDNAWHRANEFSWLKSTIARPRALLFGCPIPHHAIKA